MTGHVAIQAPVFDTETVELAKSTRIFRKEVLRVGSINYKGQKLDFTPEYLDGLAAAHREQVFPLVPLVFAPGDNSHTQDVERIRGEVLGFERRGDRLDAIVRASNDRAAQLLRENPNIGVSVRIEQPIERADGKTWPAAVQHVLATANPVVPGMAPWEPVDLAVGDVPVIDLSTLTLAELGEDTATDTEETPVADKPTPLTDEETARLRAFLEQLDALEAEGADDADVDDEPTDEELAQIAAGIFDDEDEDDAAPAEIAASSDSHALELAAQLDAQAIELAQIRAERDAERFERLKGDLADDFGIPPHVTDLAKPLLVGRSVVELSNGETVDAGGVMHQVLTALGQHVKLLDLSSPTVFEASRGQADQDEERKRETEMAAYRLQYGL